MSGYRVDHISHQIETTWDNPDGTPYSRVQAEQQARETKGIWWWDCEQCGYRVDHISHQIETTWDNPDGTPYSRVQAEQQARETKGIWWWDCEQWPVDKRNNEQGNAA